MGVVVGVDDRDSTIYHRLRVVLGLNDYEARAYMTLLRLGRARAPEVARGSGVPTGRIYDVLRGLEARGLVYRDRGFYMPTDPATALASLRERILLEARERARAVEELASELSSMAGGGGEEVRLIHGLEEAVAAAAAAARLCGESPLFTAYKAAEKAVELWPVIEHILEVVPRRARVLVHPTASIPRGLLEAVRARGVEVRRHPSVFLDIMVSCDEVIIGVPGPGGEVAALYVKSGEFAGALRERLEEAWRSAEPLP